LNICRFVYNKILKTRKNYYEQSKKSLTCGDTAKLLTQWKQTDNSLEQVDSQVLHDVNKRVDLAFTAFFRRRRCKANKHPGYPRFKSRKRYDSFTYSHSGFLLKNNILNLSKIGNIKIINHRQIQGKIKILTIRRTPTEKWYACFSCEQVVSPSSLNPSKIIGIDFGLINLATLTDGTIITNPKWYKQEKDHLAQVQRNNKPKKVVARIHERIKNKRANYFHHISKFIVTGYDVICLENLQIQTMFKSNRAFNRSLSDTSLGRLKQMIVYKAEEAGKIVCLVDPRYTSQICSQCGSFVPKALQERKHICPHCHLQISRDLNAAYNIQTRGLASLDRQGLRSPSLRGRE
jgi:putative transposase